MLTGREYIKNIYAAFKILGSEEELTETALVEEKDVAAQVQFIDRFRQQLGKFLEPLLAFPKGALHLLLTGNINTDPQSPPHLPVFVQQRVG